MEYPCKADKRGLDMSNGIKLKEAGDAAYCLQLVLSNVGLKRKQPPGTLGSFRKSLFQKLLTGVASIHSHS